MSCFNYDHKKYFSPELIRSLTYQLMRFPEGEEVDIFYCINERKFDAFVAGTHGWNELDTKAYPRIMGTEITNEDIEVQVADVLSEFIEYIDVPIGGYYARPITWKPSEIKVLIIENTRYLSPKEKDSLWMELSPLTVNLKGCSYSERYEMEVHYLPENEAAIVEILKRYIK